MFFMLKKALLFLSVIIDNHQIGEGGKNPFSGEAAFTHGNPFKYPLDTGKWNIIYSIEIKAVQIQGFFTCAAGTVFPACGFVHFQVVWGEGFFSQGNRVGEHGKLLYTVCRSVLQCFSVLYFRQERLARRRL